MTKLLKHLAVELDLDSDLDFGSMDAGSELDERDLDLTEVRFCVERFCLRSRMTTSSLMLRRWLLLWSLQKALVCMMPNCMMFHNVQLISE
jgi:hypothetical protein